MKTCLKCGEEKGLEDFHRDSKMKDGRKNICKVCKSKKRKFHRTLSESRKRFDKNINSAIYRSIKNNKSGTWERILKFSLVDLKNHLEKQFTSKMNWNNFGSYWWIDKIIPRSAYQYQNIKNNEFHKCWSLKNMRPLEKYEGVRKGDKVIWELVEKYKLFDILPLGLIIIDRKKSPLLRNELEKLLKEFVNKISSGNFDKDLYIRIMDASFVWNKAEILTSMVNKIKTLNDYDENLNFDITFFLDSLLP